MSYSLTLQPPAARLRVGLLLILSVAFWLATAASLAPGLVRASSVNPATHSDVCKCAHCSGGPTCCCNITGKCLAP